MKKPTRALTQLELVMLEVERLRNFKELCFKHFQETQQLEELLKATRGVDDAPPTVLKLTEVQKSYVQALANAILLYEQTVKSV